MNDGIYGVEKLHIIIELTHCIRTLINAVPGAPVDVTIVPSNSTATAVTLKWSPPLSPNGIILYYKITFYGHEPSDEDSKVSI